MIARNLLRNTPGLITLACQDLARYSEADASIVVMQKPDGSRYYPVSGLGVAANFNNAARVFLQHDGLQWLFCLNDDHVYAPDTLLRMIEAADRHPEYDVLTGFYLSRDMPFKPVIFDRVLDEAGHVGRRYLKPGEHGVHPAVAAGDGCLLIRRSVIERLPAPWWKLGYLDEDACNHDLYFCAKVRAAGMRIGANLDVTVEHLTPCGIKPVRGDDGQWYVELRTRGHRSRLLVPMADADVVDDGEA